MPLAAILPVIGAIGGGLIAAHGANQAAKTQADAANNGAQAQLGMYNQTRSDLAPYNTAGQAAMSQLAALFGLPSMGGGAASAPINTPQQQAPHPGLSGIVSQLAGGMAPPMAQQPGAAGAMSGGTGIPNAALATSALTQFPGYQFGLNQGVEALDRSAASRGLLLSGAQLKDTQQFGQGYAQQTGWAPYVSQLNSIAGLGENAAAQTGNAGTQAGQGISSSLLAGGEATAGGQASNAKIFSDLVQSQQFQGALASSLGSIFHGAPTAPRYDYSGTGGVPTGLY